MIFNKNIKDNIIENTIHIIVRMSKGMNQDSIVIVDMFLSISKTTEEFIFKKYIKEKNITEYSMFDILSIE